MFVKRLCISIILLLPIAVCAHQYMNQSVTSNYWIQDHEDDLVGYLVNKKKRSQKDSRFIKFDYLTQNINVSDWQLFQ